MNATLQLDGPLTSEGDATGVIGLWYQRPFGNDRPDQPNRLLPVGDTYGAYLTLELPIRSWVFSPSVSVAREHAADDARVSRLLRYQFDAASWAINAGAALTIPLGKHLDLTPEFGATFGGASVAFTATSAAGLTTAGLTSANASGPGGGTGTSGGSGGSTPAVSGRRPGRTDVTNFSASIRGWWAGLELSISF